MLKGYDRMRALTASVAHIVPAYDPMVLERHAAETGAAADIVRIDLAPR